MESLYNFCLVWIWDRWKNRWNLLSLSVSSLLSSINFTILERIWILKKKKKLISPFEVQKSQFQSGILIPTMQAKNCFVSNKHAWWQWHGGGKEESNVWHLWMSRLIMMAAYPDPPTRNELTQLIHWDIEAQWNVQQLSLILAGLVAKLLVNRQRRAKNVMLMLVP